VGVDFDYVVLCFHCAKHQAAQNYGKIPPRSWSVYLDSCTNAKNRQADPGLKAFIRTHFRAIFPNFTVSC
jgi:hypothetical protein